MTWSSAARTAASRGPRPRRWRCSSTARGHASSTARDGVGAAPAAPQGQHRPPWPPGPRTRAPAHRHSAQSPCSPRVAWGCDSPRGPVGRAPDLGDRQASPSAYSKPAAGAHVDPALPDRRASPRCSCRGAPATARAGRPAVFAHVVGVQRPRRSRPGARRRRRSPASPSAARGASSPSGSRPWCGRRRRPARCTS